VKPFRSTLTFIALATIAGCTSLPAPSVKSAEQATTSRGFCALQPAAGSFTCRLRPVDSAEPVPPEIRVVELRGHYTSGFEIGVFRPCGGFPELPDSIKPFRRRAWVDFTLNSNTRTVKWPEFPDSVAYTTVYVRWHGLLKGPASYGHRGMAAYSLMVDRILEVRHTTPADCE
jgi:hypothetical protein